MGNPRLIGWDGEKTLTFTLEDALMSPMSFAMLSGAGIVKGSDGSNNTAKKTVYVHTNYDLVAEKGLLTYDKNGLGQVNKNPDITGLDANGTQRNAVIVRLTDEDRNGATIVLSSQAPVYPVTLDSAGAQADYLNAVTEEQVYILSDPDLTFNVGDDNGVIPDAGSSDVKAVENAQAHLVKITDAAALGHLGYAAGTKEVTGQDGAKVTKTVYKPVTFRPTGEIVAPGYTLVFDLSSDSGTGEDPREQNVHVGDTVRLDLYEAHQEGAYEMTIEASNFAGYYYIEASTLFRDEETGTDLPAEFVIPRGKIQSNFTFTMANSGDPSTYKNVWVAAHNIYVWKNIIFELLENLLQ